MYNNIVWVAVAAAAAATTTTTTSCTNCIWNVCGNGYYSSREIRDLILLFITFSFCKLHYWWYQYHLVRIECIKWKTLWSLICKRHGNVVIQKCHLESLREQYVFYWWLKWLNFIKVLVVCWMNDEHFEKGKWNRWINEYPTPFWNRIKAERGRRRPVE